MARLLASGREKWIIFDEKPATPASIAPEDAAEGINVGDRATRSGTFIRAAASNTEDSTHFNSETSSVVFTESNYNAQIEPYDMKDPVTGLPVLTENEVYEAVATKGTTLWILQRRGPKEPVPLEPGQPYKLYEVVTDEPQQPETSGWMRDVIPLSVQQVWEGVVGGAGA